MHPTRGAFTTGGVNPVVTSANGASPVRPIPLGWSPLTSWRDCAAPACGQTAQLTWVSRGPGHWVRVSAARARRLRPEFPHVISTPPRLGSSDGVGDANIRLRTPPRRPLLTTKPIVIANRREYRVFSHAAAGRHRHPATQGPGASIEKQSRRPSSRPPQARRLYWSQSTRDTSGVS